MDTFLCLISIKKSKFIKLIACILFVEANERHGGATSDKCYWQDYRGFAYFGWVKKDEIILGRCKQLTALTEARKRTTAQMHDVGPSFLNSDTIALYYRFGFGSIQSVYYGVL